MSDTVKLRLYSEISDIAGSGDELIVDTKISRDEWDAMTQEERDKVGDQHWTGYIDNRVVGGWDVECGDA